MSRLLKRLQAIEELNCVLQNWCNDDGKQPEDYTATELLELANQRRSEFFEDGHVFHEALAGDLGLEEKKYAKSQLAKINRFVDAAIKVVNKALNEAKS
jgi:hypothetical protein